MIMLKYSLYPELRGNKPLPVLSSASRNILTQEIYKKKKKKEDKKERHENKTYVSVCAGVNLDESFQQLMLMYGEYYILRIFFESMPYLFMFISAEKKKKKKKREKSIYPINTSK